MDYSMDDYTVNNNNINQISQNMGFGYQSGSKSAESGVIKPPLWQHNGPDCEYNNINRMTYEERSYKQGVEKVAPWTNSQYPYMTDMPLLDVARAPSTMTLASITSNISNTSELSIITDITKLSIHSPMDVGGYPNHNTYPPTSYSGYERQSHVQRQDPNDYLNKLMQEIRRLGLNCHNQLMELRSQAKVQFFELIPKNSLESLLHHLFVMLDNFNRNQQGDEKIIEHIVWIFYYILHNVSPPRHGCAKAVTLRFIRKKEYTKPTLSILLFLLQNDMIGFDIKKLLINIINTLIVENKRYREVKDVIQKHPNLITLYMSFIIQVENKNIYSICMDSLARIISGSDPLKNEFFLFHGIEIVLDILRNNHQEKILYRAAELLHTVVSCNNETIISKFIWNDGINTCAQLLDHGSPRLLHKLAACIQCVSDYVDETMNIESVIASLVKLIGIQDHVLESMIIGCLGNFIIKKDKNKILLSKYKVPNALMRSLQNFDDATNLTLNFNDKNFPDRVKSSMKIKADLLDNILFVLQGMINIKNDKNFHKALRDEIITFENGIWLKWFWKFIGGEGIDQVRRSVWIVSNILTNICEERPAFKNPLASMYLPVFKEFIPIVFEKFYISWKWYVDYISHRWEACSCFLGERLTKETIEARTKHIFNLLSQSLKLIRILIHEHTALQTLSDYLPPDFPLSSILAEPAICEDMLRIAITLAEFNQEFCKRWNTIEIEKVIKHVYTKNVDKPNIKEAAKIFHNVLWPTNNHIPHPYHGNYYK